MKDNTNGSIPHFFYHYTSVETLSKILSQKKIKFSALDKLDDMEEGKSEDATPLRRFTYVSCWTDDSKESIPMWNMYATLDKGVRIKMKKNPFKLIDLKSYAGIVPGADMLPEDSKNRYSLISLEKMTQIPYSFNFMGWRKILHKVKYTDDCNILFPRIINEDSEKILITYKYLGKYKNTHWQFQHEWRYVINLVPENTIKLTEDILAFSKTLKEMLDEDFQSPIDIFTLDISEDAIDSMEITLSPNMNQDTEEIVHKLCEQYAPKAKITRSKLYGKIRQSEKKVMN